MSATLFLAFCVLGCDFLLYALFEWTYGEKRRRLSGRSRAPKPPMNQPNPQPFLVSSRPAGMGGVRQSDGPRLRSATKVASALGQYNIELRAHRRIVDSIGQVKR